MGSNDFKNDVIKNALSNIHEAEKQIRNVDADTVSLTQPNHAEIVSDENQTAENVGVPVSNNTMLRDSNNDVASSFVGLPIESLICGPIIAAAKGQQELTAVYVDGLMKLAYKDGKAGGDTNLLEFNVDRPVQNDDGSVTTKTFKINAPLLSLVPVPAFTMDELTVDFNMEVKNSDLSSTDTKTDVQSSLNYKSWFGLSASITGNVSSDSSHKRQTDSSATYQIHARAVQQQPSEGMAKLTSLFSQMMEPIPAKDTGK